MARFELEVDTKLPPDKVLAALTDFSADRPDVWPGLAREYYEVYSVGETGADVREGSTKPFRVWAKERYDWSTPGTVTWTVQESNFCTPGSFVSSAVTPGEGGGSRVHTTWERKASNFRGWVIVTLMSLVGRKLIASYSKKVFDGLADKQSG